VVTVIFSLAKEIYFFNRIKNKPINLRYKTKVKECFNDMPSGGVGSYSGKVTVYASEGGQASQVYTVNKYINIATNISKGYILINMYELGTYRFNVTSFEYKSEPDGAVLVCKMELDALNDLVDCLCLQGGAMVSDWEAKE
jgi:hypothetical protein